VDAVVAEHGRLDVIVNNAGIMPVRPMQDCNTDEWDAMVDINIKGVLYGIAAALPIFIMQNGGQFINMSSIAGVKVFAPGGTVYSGTKFAVRAISDGLRLEVGPKIRVCSIEPGSVDSELKYNTTGSAQKMVLDLYAKTAIPAETIARAIAYAMEQPPDVDINEIIIRPTAQEF
jgi:NADP-dependent 3-hydroxy acid dehydrogenase YdfG